MKKSSFFYPVLWPFIFANGSVNPLVIVFLCFHLYRHYLPFIIITLISFLFVVFKYLLFEGEIYTVLYLMFSLLSIYIFFNVSRYINVENFSILLFRLNFLILFTLVFTNIIPENFLYTIRSFVVSETYTGLEGISRHSGFAREPSDIGFYLLFSLSFLASTKYGNKHFFITLIVSILIYLLNFSIVSLLSIMIFIFISFFPNNKIWNKLSILIFLYCSWVLFFIFSYYLLPFLFFIDAADASRFGWVTLSGFIIYNHPGGLDLSFSTDLFKHIISNFDLSGTQFIILDTLDFDSVKPNSFLCLILIYTGFFGLLFFATFLCYFIRQGSSRCVLSVVIVLTLSGFLQSPPLVPFCILILALLNRDIKIESTY